MLAEYGFQFHQHVASPWNREETIFETEPRLPGFDDVQVEIELSGDLDENSVTEQLSVFADDDTCSLGTSHLSSEFDEDVSIDDKKQGVSSNHGVFGCDFLTNCFINNLNEVCFQDGASSSSVSLENLDSVLQLPISNNIDVVSDDGSHESSSSIPSSGSCSPSLPRKRRRKLDDVPWSEMSYNEKQTLLETISVSVSDLLGPREQLELLRIIDPDVESLPCDGQFTIEPDFLDNEKLQRIQKLIDGQMTSCQASNPSGSSSPRSKQRQTRSTSSPKSSQKKKQSKERRNQLKALRQRQRKEYKQNMKEKRSGLFQKEEVLALQSQSLKEEEEIDILG